ncbi:MAG: hypothetical protein FJ011_04225 [Chloroflexi bacterium]|nr:hypothetical protein [Chloroflexota bacterium]
MPKKSSSIRRPASTEPVALARWRQILLLLTIIPMLAGVILFVAAWADWVFIGAQAEQTVTGALLALLGFAAANLLQSRWLLACGWTSAAAAVWLVVSRPAPWAGAVGAIAGATALIAVVIEFGRRFRRPAAGG